MQSMFRRSVQMFSVAGAFAVLNVAIATSAGAQSGGGNWGAEGRIGSNQSASLIRWFNPSWSLVLNGSAGVATSKNEGLSNIAAEGTSSNLNASVLLRKEFGTGRVRPHMAFGPTFFASRTENKTTSGSGGVSRTNQDITNVGGRFELGGIASVTEHVGLGIIGGASVTRNYQENRTQNSESTVKGFGFSLTSPQFVVRVRF
jgi:hypothetical protein